MALALAALSTLITSGATLDHKRTPFDQEVKLLSLDRLKDPIITSSDSVRLPKQFTIAFTGDTHSHLDPSVNPDIQKVDRYVDPSFYEKPLGGVVRRIHYLEQCRNLMPNPVLILDAGDFLQGTPYFEEFQGSLEIEFMNRAGVHVITVGNHDFDKGWEHLEKLLEAGRFQTVCGNIFREKETTSCLPPYCLLQINNQKVAVVGIMGLTAWESIAPSKRKGLRIENPSETLDRILPEIREYVELVIILSHSGIKDDTCFAKHPMVDLVIGGHSHTFMNEAQISSSTEKVASVFHAYRHGILVGMMDWEFTDKGFTCTRSYIQYLDGAYDAPLDDDITCNLGIYRKAIADKFFIEVLGTCNQTFRKEGRTEGLVPLGRLIANILRIAGEADVGVIYSGAIKKGIDIGDLTTAHLHEILPHSEPLWKVTMKGSLLLDLAKAGQKRWGNNKTFQYEGMVVESTDDGSIKVTVDNKEIDETSFYTVAASSYFFEREILDGKGEKVPDHLKDKVQNIECIHEDSRTALANLIREKGFEALIAEKEAAAI